MHNLNSEDEEHTLRQKVEKLENEKETLQRRIAEHLDEILQLKDRVNRQSSRFDTVD